VKRLLVVLNVGPNDTDLAVATLKASTHLCGRIGATLALALPRKQTFPLAIAEAAFGEVRIINYDEWTGDPKWPAPQNHSWQQVARQIHASNASSPDFNGWFWWEPDAVPLRAGWYDLLNDTYRKSSKSFAGFESAYAGTPYMNGVGIWPCDSIDKLTECSALYTYVQPFDIAAGPCAMRSFKRLNGILLHHRKPRGGGPGVAFSKATCARMLVENPLAVFYHGCTDGSLHTIMQGGEPPELPAPTLSAFDLLTQWKGSDTTKVVNNYIHCTERHTYADARDNERVLSAFHSWTPLYKQGSLRPCHVWETTRTSATMGDPRKLPYLKDVLVEGMTMASSPNDVIVLTNDDTILHPTVLHALDKHLATTDAVTSMRLNFPSVDWSKPVEELRCLGKPDLGRDLFAFRKSWLQRHWHRIPDFLLGELEWDIVLTCLVRQAAGVQTDRTNLTDPCPVCELERGYVLHVVHDRTWAKRNQVESPSKLHNRTLALQWYIDNGLESMVQP